MQLVVVKPVTIQPSDKDGERMFLYLPYPPLVATHVARAVDNHFRPLPAGSIGGGDDILARLSLRIVLSWCVMRQRSIYVEHNSQCRLRSDVEKNAPTGF